MSEAIENHVEQEAPVSVSESEGAPQGESAPVEHENPSVETGQSSEDTQFGELPRYAKERLGKQKKKHEREMREMAERMKQIEAQNAQLATQFQPNQAMQNDQSNMLFDPFENKYVDPESTRGQVMLEMQRQQQLNTLQQEQTRQQQMQDYIKTKSNDFVDEVGAMLDANPALKSELNVDGMNATMLETIALAPNRKDLFAYLAKNPKEIDRISKLPQIQQVGEIMQHMINASKQSVSRAPEPVQPLRSSGSKSAVNRSVNNMNYSDLKAQLRDKERGRFRR